MALAPILVIGGLVVFAWLFLWSRQRQQSGQQIDYLSPLAANDDAVLVAREHGQLIYMNEAARRWVGVDGGEPYLEFIAQQTQPPESFLELFTGEKQASFQLNGRWVEGTSHRIPSEVETRTVVVLRELTGKAASSDGLDLSATMSVINEIGETVNAGLGIEQALQALLSIVRKAVPADAGEICLWDEERRVLHPRGWIGDVTYVLSLAEAGGLYQIDEGITGWIARYQEPVLVSSRHDPTAVQPKLPNSSYKSFVGVPLLLENRFVGTFELASETEGCFTQADMALLQAVAKPVATSIYNAELYAEQVRRIEDMASLQRLSQDPDDQREVSKIYQVLSERVAKLLAADMCGVLLYDERRDALVAEPPFYGLPIQLVQSYILPLTIGSPQRDIFEDREYWISNDLADEPLAVMLKLENFIYAAGMYNAVLMPLQIGQRRIGMLLVGNKRSHGGFSSIDIQNLRILSAQASVVVENTRLFQIEQRVDTELSGLQEITHAIGAMSHEDELYSDINQRIARLMKLSMSGVLVYEEDINHLTSRLPFYGVEDDLVREYAVPLKPGSAMEHIWRDEDYWYSNRVSTDSIIFEAGLAESLAAMGVTKTMFVVLSAGGRRLGMLQASNKLDGSDFTDKDARLLQIFATQAAALIENGRLYREMQRRADEAESVRRVAELAGAVMTAEDSFIPTLSEISRLLDSPIVFVSTLSSETGALVTLPRHVFGYELAEPTIIDVYSKGFENSVAMSRRSFTSNDVANDNRIMAIYQQLAGELSLNRVIMVPLVVGDRSLGEMGIANRQRIYTQADRQMLMAIAVQVAAALDRVRLHEATGQNLSRRLQELDAISRVSNELNLTLELDRVLEVIRREAMHATDATGCTIAILEPRADWRKPDQPELNRRLGDRLVTAYLAAIEQKAIQTPDHPVLVEDYSHSEIEPLPAEARSAIAAAILYADEPVGVVHIYHNTAGHFDTQAATFLGTLAAKASLGYANALRYQENLDRSASLRRRVEQLNQIFELGQMLQSNIDPVTVLEAIAYSVQQSVGFDSVLMTMADDEGNLRRVAQAGLPIDAFERSRKMVLPKASIEKALKDEYRISESYFLPLDRVADWYSEGMDTLSISFDGKRSLRPRVKNDWREGDMLLVPMMGPGGNMLGIMSLDRPFDNQRPDRGTIEILEIFAHQAANTIENVRLYQASQSSAEQEARLNEVMEAITSTLDMHEIVQTVARGALRLLPFSRMTVALLDAEQNGFHLIRVDVNPDQTLNVTPDRRANLDKTALGHTFETVQDFIYRSTDTQLRSFQDLREWHLEGEQTSLIVPLITGGLCLGAMHIGSDLKNAFGFEEYRALIKRIANLSAVAIQNARLFNQAVNLRLFNESIIESIQQGIVVLDSNGNVIVINHTMRERFGWDDKALNKALFDYKPELGFLKRDVMAVTGSGKPRERINQRMENADGSTAVYSFYLYPLLSADRTRGLVLLTEDVTERARLEEDIKNRANQLAVLAEVSGRITAALDRDEVIDLAIKEMERIIPADMMSIWIRQDDFMLLEGARGLLADSPVEALVKIEDDERIRRVVESQYAYSVSPLPVESHLPGDQDAQSWLGVPLLNQTEVIGMIALAKKEANFYDQQAEQAALSFANQVAITLVNAQLFSDSQRRTQRLSLLNRVSLALAQSLDNENILETALREIAQVTRIEYARAYILERDVKLARVIVEYPRGDAPPDMVVDITSSPVIQYVTRQVEPLVIESAESLESSNPVLAEIARRKATAYVALPMTVGGRAIGMFELEVYSGSRHFDPEQIDLSLIIANQAAIAVQNANLLEQTLVRTRELETLLEAAQSTSFTTDLEEVFQNVARLTLQALDMDDCMILLYDQVEGELEVQIDLNRYGERENIVHKDTILPLQVYPARQEALNSRHVQVIHRADPNADAKEREELEALRNTSRMLVPLIVRDQAIGLIVIDVKPGMRSLTHQDIRMAQALCAQAATAIENARLSTETAHRVEELLVINDLSRAISSTMDIDSMIKIVRAQVPNLTDAEEVYLALYEAEANQITFPMAVRRGKDVEMPPRALGNDEVSFVIRHRRLLALGGDFTLEEMRKNLGIVSTELDAKAYLGVPLISGDRVLGALAVTNMTDRRAFGLNDQRILTTIGTQLGAAIQNARLFNQIRSFADELNRRVEERTVELQQERDRIDVLYRITSELARTLDMDRVLHSALEMVVNAVKADEGVILLIDPMTDKLYNRASYLDPSNWHGEHRSHPADVLGTWLLNNVHAIIIDDLHQLDYWNHNRPGAAEWRSALAVLLETNDDVQGVMVFLSRQVGVFTDAQLRLTTAAANQVATAINNADLYNLIRDQAERLGTLLRAEQEEAEKSTAILEGIADGVILSDANNNIILFNSSAERILELSRDQVLAQPFARLATIVRHPSSGWVYAIESWTNPNFRLGTINSDRLELGDRVINVQVSPINVGDQRLGTVYVFRDITRDVEVDRMKSEFISNVSHELRTPMTSIKGYADLLIMGAAGQLTDIQRNFLSTIKSNADRLTYLVNDLLNISKLDSGSERLRFDNVDIGDTIRGVVTSLAGRANHEKKNIHVDIRVEVGLPEIRADRDKITQVIVNVVDNAFNYTYAGGSIEIGAQLRTDKEHILISVKDTGIGIPEEFQDRVWGRFERFEEHALVMDVAGTGLGLPIAKDLVEMHHGEIWFESVVNQGTTFFISLPIRQPEGETQEMSSSQPAGQD